MFVALRISEINDPPLPKNPFLIKAVCYKNISQGSAIFSLETNAFEIIFKSTLSKEIGLQFMKSVLSRSLFWINLITAWSWEVLHAFFNSLTLLNL